MKTQTITTVILRVRARARFSTPAPDRRSSPGPLDAAAPFGVTSPFLAWPGKWTGMGFPLQR